MKVTLAKSAGFCFGVKRAVETVYDEIMKTEKLYINAPDIHEGMVITVTD